MAGTPSTTACRGRRLAVDAEKCAINRSCPHPLRDSPLQPLPHGRSAQNNRPVGVSVLTTRRLPSVLDPNWPDCARPHWTYRCGSSRGIADPLRSSRPAPVYPPSCSSCRAPAANSGGTALRACRADTWQAGE